MADLIDRQATHNNDSNTLDALDCVSRQAAIEWCRPEDWGTPDERWRPESEYGAMLETLPSAQPGIVRCRECKYHDGVRCFRWNSTIITEFDDFCSNGVRRIEDE